MLSFWDVCERKGKQWRSLTSALSAGGPVSSTTSEWSEFNSKPRVKAFWLLSGGVLLTGHWWTCRDKILIRIIMVQLNELNILCKAYTHNDKFMISTFTLRFLFVSDRLVPRLVKSKTKWSFFPALNDQKLTCHELMGWEKKEFLNHTFEWVGAWGYNNSTQPKLTLIALFFPPHITLKQSESEKKKIPIPIKFTKICQQSAHFTNPLKNTLPILNDCNL